MGKFFCAAVGVRLEINARQRVRIRAQANKKVSSARTLSLR